MFQGGKLVSFWSILLISTLLIIGEVNGQQQNSTNCGAQLSDFVLCVENATLPIVRDCSPIVGQIEKCLNLAKCQPDTGSNDTAPSSTATTEVQGFFTQLPSSKFWTCVRNASDDLQTRAQTCIVQKVPDWNDTRLELEQVVAKISKNPIDYGSEMRTKLANLCPDKKTRDAASACIDMAVRKYSKPADISSVAGKLCKAKTDCQDRLTSDCRKRLEEVYQAGCACLQSEWPESSNRFFDCLDNKIVNSFRRILDGRPYFTPKANSRFCNLFDPCKGAAPTSDGSTSKWQESWSKVMDLGKSMFSKMFGGEPPKA